LSGLSKVMAVSFPLVIMGIDFINQKKKLDLKTILLYVPFLLIAVWLAVYGYQLRNSEIHAAISNSAYSLFDTPFLVNQQYLWYLKNVFFPFDLHSNYGDPTAPGWFFYGSIIFGISGMLLLIKKRKYTLILLGALLLIIPLLPVIKFKPTGHSFIADRYFYVSFLGLLILLAALFNHVTKCKKTLHVLGCLFLVTCVYQTFQEKPKWKNNITIWTNAIEGIYHNNSYAYEARCKAYQNAKQYNLALSDIHKAIELEKKENNNNNNTRLQSLKQQVIVINQKLINPVK
jgi:hypothetical protein